MEMKRGRDGEDVGGDVESSIQQVEREIKAVEKDIAEVVKKLAPLEEKEESKSLDNDERNRIAALREDKKQLREKEKQLREEKILLLRDLTALKKVKLPEDVNERAEMLLKHVSELRMIEDYKHEPKTVFSDSWPLFDRDGALEEICAAAENNQDCFKNKDNQKQNYQCVVITGAAGTGKTRLCMETPAKLALTQAVKGCHKHFDVFVTFLNGEQISMGDDKLSGSVILGLRVACKLFPALGLCSFRCLSDFRKVLGDLVDLCDLKTVMRLFAHQHPDRETPLWLTLVLDEAHFAEKPEDENAPRVWPAIMSALMSYVIPGVEEQPQVKDKVILFPIISSTWTVERTKYHVSPGTKVFPVLGPLSQKSFEVCIQQLDGLVPKDETTFKSLLSSLEFRQFLMTTLLAPRCLAMALRCVANLNHDGVPEAIHQICQALRGFYKTEKIEREVFEFAMSGVSIPVDVKIKIGTHSFAHWLSMGIASGSAQKPLAVPFPLLFNEAGYFMKDVSTFLQWGQPFYWQDFEALVPHVIRLRCSSLYRVKDNHRATLKEIFGSGPAYPVVVHPAMAVVICKQQWLVKTSKNIKTPDQQLKVKSLTHEIDHTALGTVQFGSCAYVFAAADGNVHFDGHIPFETDDGRYFVAFYQVKHTQINPDKGVASFKWDDIETWLKKSRDFVKSLNCEKLFVIITNKKVDHVPANFPTDLIMIHQDNLGTFFAPCFLSSARLAKDQ